MAFKYGWRQSTGDLGIAPFKVGAKLTTLGVNSDPALHLIPEYPPVFNQLQLGSCVANSSCGMLEMLVGLQNPALVKALSRMFLYWDARLAIGETNKDDGSFIHDALFSLKDKGICEESIWPYLESKVFTQPNQLAYKQGDDNTMLADYYEITSIGNQRLLEIEAAIRANHPVVFGTQVGEELQTYTDGVLGIPAKPEGGHAILAVGVRRNPNLEFYIRNSWGAGWGDNGHCWFSSEYMAWDQTDDIFVGTQMKDLLL